MPSEKSLDKTWTTNNGPKPYNVFYVWYTELCRRMNMAPLTTVKPSKLKNENVLDFVVDRIKLDEWNPVIRSLRQDTSLHVIAVRSRVIKAGNKFLPDLDTREKVRSMKKRCSLILTPFILRQLLKSLVNCIQNSSVLSSLELDGLPVFGEYFEYINDSLVTNRTIRVLSFTHCPIGDSGCEILAKNLRTLPNIEVINLTSCELGPQSAQQLAKVIKYQQINRYCESWHCSLRYEDPDIERMTGLKRITLNNNPRIGDEGLEYIINELQDDLWIKAIDMQRCNITEKIARTLIDVIGYSKSLEVADFRHNELSQATLEKILDILNAKQNKEPEFRWCYTTSTLPCNDSMYDICSSINIQKTTSAPLRRPSFIKNNTVEGREVPLKRSKTFSLMNRQHNTRVSLDRRYPQVDELSQAKKEIINLGNKLKVEMSKRRQIEQENIHLKQQLLIVKQSRENLKSNSKLKMHVPTCSVTKVNEKKKEAPLLANKPLPKSKSQVTFLFPPQNAAKPEKTKAQQIFIKMLQNTQNQKKDTDDKVNRYLKVFTDYQNIHTEKEECESDRKSDKKVLQNLLQELRENSDDDMHLSIDSGNEDYDESPIEDPTDVSSEERNDKFNENDLMSFLRQYDY